MTYEQRAAAELGQVDGGPYHTVCAIVYALLAIAAAINSLPRKGE